MSIESGCIIEILFVFERVNAVCVPKIQHIVSNIIHAVQIFDV